MVKRMGFSFGKRFEMASHAQWNFYSGMDSSLTEMFIFCWALVVLVVWCFIGWNIILEFLPRDWSG
jgi:hypothetical protein